jgi:hypothetical protein
MYGCYERNYYKNLYNNWAAIIKNVPLDNYESYAVLYKGIPDVNIMIQNVAIPHRDSAINEEMIDFKWRFSLKQYTRRWKSPSEE